MRRMERSDTMEPDAQNRRSLAEELETVRRRETALRLAVKLCGSVSLTDGAVFLYDVEQRKIQLLCAAGQGAPWQALDGLTPEAAVERSELTGTAAILFYDVFRSVERGRQEGEFSFTRWREEEQRAVLCRYATLLNEGGAPDFGVILIADNTLLKRVEALELCMGLLTEEAKKRGKILLINPANDMIEYESENGDLSLAREGITHFQHAKDYLLSKGFVRPESKEKWRCFFDSARLIGHLREDGFSDVLRYKGDNLFGRDREITVAMTIGKSAFSPEPKICLHFWDSTDRAAVPAAHTGRAAPKVEIRAFGHFEVFVDGRPISFQHSKAKEMLAALVDRRGGFMTTAELIGYLWEEEPSNKTTQSRCRQVASRLKRILEENGVGDILESVNGRRRLVAERVRCDYYDYLADKQKNRHLFSGSYMANYSWGEGTLVDLENEQ